MAENSLSSESMEVGQLTCYKSETILDGTLKQSKIWILVPCQFWVNEFQRIWSQSNFLGNETSPLKTVLSLISLYVFLSSFLFPFPSIHPPFYLFFFKKYLFSSFFVQDTVLTCASYRVIRHGFINAVTCFRSITTTQIIFLKSQFISYSHLNIVLEIKKKLFLCCICHLLLSLNLFFFN